jgi:hypothetical protein
MMTIALAMLAAPASASAQQAPPARTAAAAPLRVLFVGNSFTQGSHSAVRDWRADSVEDLNGGGNGGVPALFRRFAEQAGLRYAVSLQVRGGATLGSHLDERRALIDRPWDIVVLQEYSTLDPARPGDATAYMRDVARFAAMLRARNPRVRTFLMPTWTRADQMYRPQGHWYGKPVSAMADDLHAAADRARAATPGLAGVIPVGKAWNRAFARHVADPNPYDGTSFGQVNLWAWDHYHASVHGSYLEALVVFGSITGVDPRTLGAREQAADALGIAPAVAVQLQTIAAEQLAFPR